MLWISCFLPPSVGLKLKMDSDLFLCDKIQKAIIDHWLRCSVGFSRKDVSLNMYTVVIININSQFWLCNDFDPNLLPSQSLNTPNREQSVTDVYLPFQISQNLHLLQIQRFEIEKFSLMFNKGVFFFQAAFCLLFFNEFFLPQPN